MEKLSRLEWYLMSVYLEANVINKFSISVPVL